MRWIKNRGYYQLRLETGEELLSTLVEFVRKRRLRSGFLIGLGAGSDFLLGYYHLDTRTYRRRRFKGEYEITALIGNIAWDGKQPVCHLHITLSGRNFNTVAGHLFEGTVGATCEVVLFPGDRKIFRKLDPATGLKLLDLPRVPTA